jgi:RHS repeat-associated protein
VLGRKTAEYNITGGQAPEATNQLALWTYDTLKRGQPTSVTTYTNPAKGATDATNTYVEAQLGYTALYQSTGESVSVPSSQGALQGNYESTNAYLPETSLLFSIGYGADGGLPGEQVNLGHNVQGELDGFSGISSYLNLAQYSTLGQIQATNFGAEGEQLNRVETYDQATGRLVSQSDQLQSSTATSTLDDTGYTYNQAGQITAESDTRAGVSTADTQCFTYNNLGELTTAFTSTDAVDSGSGSGSGSGSTQIQGVGGCADTAPVAGKVTGGPAPYWESYSYDTLGDRVQEIDHDTSVTSTANNVTQSLSYSGYNATTGASTAAATPDAVEAVTTTGPTGTATSNYQYFADGEVESRSGQSFEYDPEGQTTSVTDTGTGLTSTYTYDASGTLLVQTDPAADQTILYLPWGEQLSLDTGNGQVTGNRYYTESPDGLVVVRSSDGTVTYEGDISQGTATLAVNAANLAYTFRYYDPYGNVRGTAPASWPDQHSYLGEPQDPTTDLDLLGAREYDPITGRFLSVDPQLEVGDRRQMNGYSYGADDPVNGTDPTGQRWLPPAGGCGDKPCPLPKWVTDPGSSSSGSHKHGSFINQGCDGSVIGKVCSALSAVNDSISATLGAYSASGERLEAQLKKIQGQLDSDLEIGQMNEQQYTQREKSLENLESLLKSAEARPGTVGLAASSSSTLTEDFGETSTALASLTSAGSKMSSGLSAAADFTSLSSASGLSLAGVGVVLNLWSNYTTDENVHGQSRLKAATDAGYQTGADTLISYVAVVQGAEWGGALGSMIGPEGGVVGAVGGALVGAAVSFFANNGVNDLISHLF